MRTLLNIDEVALIVGLPTSTLYQQRHRRVGVGSLAIRVGRHLRWRESDIEQWLDEQVEQSKAEAVG